MMIYIHVPFCVRKCLYCDFLSFPIEKEENRRLRNEYVKALLAEIHAVKSPFQEKVSSVFFGGGTPSLLAEKEICEIMDLLRNKFDLEEDAEITLEANPGTVTRNKAFAFKEAGINRISMGAQAFQDPLLKKIGRIHTKEDIFSSLDIWKEAGFHNISLDLMFGLPGQTLEDWKDSLDTAVKLGLTHLSCYSLILEEGTPLYEQQDALSFPEEETERSMYHECVRFLKEQGYHRYEISNFAKEGYESRHNLGYWKRTPYLGFGPGAASLTPSNERYTNTSDLLFYLKNSSDPSRIQENRETLSLQDQMEEFMFLGLRTEEGVSTETFLRSFGKPIEDVYADTIQKHLSEKLLIKEGTNLRLTDLGMDVANYVMSDYMF